MSLLQKIKDDQLVARKEKRVADTALLTTLIGEASMVGKDDGNRESTDAEVMAVIRKFIKNLDEVISITNTESIAYGKAMDEKKFLLSYLPKQLTEYDLTSIVNEHISMTTNTNVGSVMKFLKEFYGGKYDGKLASQVVKKCLGE